MSPNATVHRISQAPAPSDVAQFDVDFNRRREAWREFVRAAARQAARAYVEAERQPPTPSDSGDS